MNVDTQYYHHREAFAMERGGQLPEFTLAYETWGQRADRDDNAILVFTGMSPGAHAASHDGNPEPGWWEAMIGPGRPIDTDRWFVICANSLGSCKGSTGPASTNPDTGAPYRLDFPDLTLGDVARSTRCLIEHLGIDQLAAVVGPSMGGMTAMAYILTYPQSLRRYISISSALRPTAFAIAVRSLQREFVRADRDWNGGNYVAGAGPALGMRLARKLGMSTYRSANEWELRFANERLPREERSAEPFGVEFQIESYLALHADRFAGSFDPNCYLYLSRAMDRYDATGVDGGLSTRLSAASLESALVLGVGSDTLFPLQQQKNVASALEDAGVDVTFRALDSIQGHDSFLVDTENFGLVIANYLAAE